MKYLAIDNALAVSGWAIFEDKKLVEWGKFTTKATDPIEERLGQIIDALDMFYSKYKFDMILFEDCQAQSNRNLQTYHKLSMVKAMILYWCGTVKIPYECSSPSHWRSVLKEKCGVTFGRNRANQKAAAKQFVKNHFNVTASEDECDAICLGYAGILDKKSKKTAW